MKLMTVIFCLLVLTFSLFGQRADEILATAANKKFTAEDLKPEVRAAWLNLPKTRAEKRRTLLDRQIGDTLLETEAAARKVPLEKLYQTEIAAKVPTPTDAQIQAIYNANRAALGNRSLTEARGSIVDFLRREAEEKVRRRLVETLKTKYRAALVKDVNAANLSSTDILATLSGKTISVKDFETRNARRLFELEAEAFDLVWGNLQALVASDLLATEAAELETSSGAILAREITDKLREYTPDEQESLRAALVERLFTKYKARFLIKEPEPFVEKVAVDDDPAEGAATAPVTIVMFSDFQCSYCAATHPVLKRVLAEYKGKVRFVVRDFPLESIHPDAFRAAVAANAAHAQGKFFEYIEVLYQNQNQLDAESLKKYAADLGLNPGRFALDLGNEKFAAEVRKDLADGRNYGIGGTPTIFVNGVKVRDMSSAGFRRAIERALKK